MATYSHSYPPGDLIGDQYRIMKRYEGGISEVYQCRNELSGEFVALKTLKPHFIDDQEHMRRFLEQTEVWVKLGKHPNIVWCRGLDMLDDHVPFMFLEWVSSERGRHPDLRGWLRIGKLNLQQVLTILIDICNGMIYANDLYRRDLNADLVHLDIKPDNILIAPGQVAKITDFGMARVIHDKSREIIGKGTAAYMAPEQWTRDVPVNVSTDIYSFGCMFYEMVTEKQPFEGSVYELSRKHRQSNADFSLIPDLLLPIVQRCMQKQQKGRYQSFQEVKQALEEIYISEFDAQPVVRAVQAEYTVEDYSNRAATYMRLGNYEEALLDIDAALVIQPEDSYLNAYKGLAFSALDRHEKAIEYLERSVEEISDNAQIYFMLGIAYKQSENLARALDSFNRAIDLDSTHLTARYHRALTLVGLERVDEAIRDFTDAIRQRKDVGEFFLYRGMLYRMKGEYSLAIGDMTRAIQVNKGLAEAYLERANVYLQHLRRHNDAIEDIRSYIDMSPDEPEAYAVLGRLYTEIELYDEAVRNFNICLQLVPDDAGVYCERGNLYSEMHNYGKALADFDKAEELSPTLSLPHSLRGVTLSRMGRHKEALESFTLASKLDPADLLHVRGRTFLYAETERYEQGIQEVSRLIVEAPNEKWAYYVRAHFLQQMEKYQQAHNDLDHALSIDKNFYTATLARGHLRLKMDRLDDALNDFEYVRQRNPRNYDAWVGLGQYYEKLNNHPQALMHYKRAAELGSPNGGEAYNLLAKEVGIPMLHFDPLDTVFAELMNATSIGEIQIAAQRLPFMVDPKFISMLQRAIIINNDPRRIALIRRNLSTLKHIARHMRR